MSPNALYWVKISTRWSDAAASSKSSMSFSTLPERWRPLSVTAEPSPRKCAGWLHTCLMRVMVANTSPLRAIPLRSSSSACVLSTSALYSAACSGVMSTAMTCSALSGKSEMIAVSVFRRRRINGAVRRCSRSPISSASSGSLRDSMALAKWLRKKLCEPSIPGLTKSRMLRSSESLFSIGVPVSAMRCRAGIARTLFDDCVPAFLIACASSNTT